ncbi:MAG: hypothetical protein AAGI69_28935 [Cyanobacteria bacterium P01_H01_bin.21]
MRPRLMIKNLSILLAVASAFSVVEAPAIASAVTSRALNNTSAEVTHRIECRNNSHITGMVVDEQYNYGVIDVRFNCSNGTTTLWATRNPNADNRFSLRGSLVGLEVFEQYGYGVIDFRYFKRSGRVGEVGRFTYNPRENRTSYVECPNKAYGAEIYEQSGYGIVDIALLCRPASEARRGTRVPNPRQP